MATHDIETGVGLVSDFVDVLSALADDNARVAGDNKRAHRDLRCLSLARITDTACAAGNVTVLASAIRNRAAVALNVGRSVSGNAGAKVDGVLLLGLGLCGGVCGHVFGVGGRRRRKGFGLDLVDSLYVWALGFGFGRGGVVSFTLYDT